MSDPRWTEITTGLDKMLSGRLTLAFLGSASAGKDAAIRALFGVDFGEVDPVPGSTERLRVVALDGEGRFLVINAPGFGDIRAEVDAVARGWLDHLDLVVYVVNAEGGATIDERRDLEAIRRRAGGGPTLVCLNKIDLIRPHQREEFVARTLEQLGVPPTEAVACAFDPHPAIAEEPLNLDKVIAWIDGRLKESGKELLFARQLRDKRAACRPLIARAAKKAALAGAVPVPGADITAVTWIQVRMVQEIAAVHGQALDQDVVLWMIGELLAGGAKGFIRWATQALKAAGWLPGAQAAQAATAALASGIAAGATYGVGEAAIRYVQSERRLSIDELRAVFDAVALKAATEEASK
ncbi:MAG: DUF697 domain-containing protein [Alphaproteobacteria bacterium]|nr:DUF697 domain-containing protein [Alphaproteobacteria bacterium]MCB9793875.1 DUF697 domain-containing protein [Alphaproteobacteria bacterium]